MIVLFSCLSPAKNTIPQPQEISPQETTETKPTIVPSPTEPPQKTPTLAPITVSNPLPEALYRDWPGQKWSYAKGYAYNFIPFGPGQNAYIYKKGVWNEKIEQTIDLTKEQANYAISLVQHTAGGVESSGCIFPRHGIVYFNETNEPIASINYCFSCEGFLVWPPYLGDFEAENKKYEYTLPSKKADAEPHVIKNYYELMPLWNTLFLEVLALPNPNFSP